MGVYYYFYNVTNETVNKRPVPDFNVKFNSEMELIESIKVVFSSVISMNSDWCENDIIHACPDNTNFTTIIYQNDVVTFE